MACVKFLFCDPAPSDQMITFFRPLFNSFCKRVIPSVSYVTFARCNLNQSITIIDLEIICGEGNRARLAVSKYVIIQSLTSLISGH